MVQISERLQAVARLVTVGGTVADVGCDHGYIPVYLIETGKIKQAIAMDVNKGPLSRAKEHIEQYGMQKKVELRLSDGVQALQQGEADCVVIAGMGGGLVQKILSEGEQILQQTKELILQPQSEISRVRAYLREHGYQITNEDMVIEDGKYYPMMRVLHETDAEAVLCKNKQEENRKQWKETVQESEQMMQNVLDLYGPCLLADKHPVLKQYLEREAALQEQIFSKLQNQTQTEKIQNRRKDLTYEIQKNRIAYHRMEE